ncbi:MAG: RNA 2'-phosphotransferase [Planctomycetota bacterium]|nr:RNA 2'-phosphotransferase [Planctomycetota bacterium]
MDDRLVRKSKLLSLVLRHRPEEFGIALDRQGWTPIEGLLDALDAHRKALTRTDLDSILQGGDRKRFELSADGAMIRATHGHSVPVDLGHDPAAPPEFLYHGTVRENLESIRAAGLDAAGRTYCHLSSTLEAASIVGSRRGQAVILTIRASEMAGDGHLFHHSSSDIWLTKSVPPQFIEFPPESD